jgi:predicted AAA+ superfamily ATPase
VAAGPLFETAVFAQLHRLFLHHGQTPRIYFWRTAAGHEVDFVIESGTRLIPVEAKLTSAPTSRQATAISEYQRLLRSSAGDGFVVSLCGDRFPLTDRVQAVPLGSF